MWLLPSQLKYRPRDEVSDPGSEQGSASMDEAPWRPVAQLDRATAFYAVGCGFDSRRDHDLSLSLSLSLSLGLRVALCGEFSVGAMFVSVGS